MNAITYVFEKCLSCLFVRLINIMHTKTLYYCAFIASNLFVPVVVMFVSPGNNVRFLGYLEKNFFNLRMRNQVYSHARGKKSQCFESVFFTIGILPRMWEKVQFFFGQVF